MNATIETKGQNYEARLEVHFHQQSEVSIFLENTSSGDKEIKSDLYLLTFYIVRNLANLEQDNISGKSLAHTLRDIEVNGYEVFRPERFYDLSLTAYQGHKGRKSFIANIFISDEKIKFKLKPKGFGLFGKGLLYYSPASVIMLIKYLWNKHKHHIGAMNAIRCICRLSGENVEDLTVYNQSLISKQIAIESIDVFEKPIKKRYSDHCVICKRKFALGQKFVGAFFVNYFHLDFFGSETADVYELWDYEFSNNENDLKVSNALCQGCFRKNLKDKNILYHGADNIIVPEGFFEKN